MLIAAAILCLTTISVVAAQQGGFGAIFRNFGDVSGYVQESGLYVNSNGITMQLANYLADDRGMVMELVFTMDDGGVFPEGISPVHEQIHGWGLSSSLRVAVRNSQQSGQGVSQLSPDGRTLTSIVMVDYFSVRTVEDMPLEIFVSKLVYDENRDFFTVEADLYAIFNASEVIIADELTDIYNDIFDLFTDAPRLETPITSDLGPQIDTVIFASVRESSVELPDWYHLVGIRYRRHSVQDHTEQFMMSHFLAGNDDFFGTSMESGEYLYRFYRVANFADLQNLHGINFMEESRSFIPGEWNISTTFSPNRETTRIETNFTVETTNPDVFIVLSHVEISLLSTTLGYDVVNAEGRRIRDSELLHNYFWGQLRPHEIEFKLLFDNGDVINMRDFPQSGAGMLEDGLFTTMYSAKFSRESFVLMNTTRLSGVLVAGEVFEIE
jgi:hypothetical protein